MMKGMRAAIWIVEGTWQGCVDAARDLLPADAEVLLLHAASEDAQRALEGAVGGLLGRGPHHHPSGPTLSALSAAEADALLAGAEQRLGRGSLGRIHVQSGVRAERAIVDALTAVDVLVVARDGERSRLGPHSFGHMTRFVVDHAPCTVIVAWPDEAPSPQTIPPPPPHPPH